MSSKVVKQNPYNQNLNKLILETKEEYKQVMIFLKEKYQKKEQETFSKNFHDSNPLTPQGSQAVKNKETIHLSELDNDRLTSENIHDLMTYSNLISLLFKQNNLINVSLLILIHIIIYYNILLYSCANLFIGPS